MFEVLKMNEKGPQAAAMGPLTRPGQAVQRGSSFQSPLTTFITTPVSGR